LETRTVASAGMATGLLGTVWRRLPLRLTALLGNGFYRRV
jgi:hypothetical protein